MDTDANAVAEIVKSQPPDVQRAIWERYDEHIKWLRALVDRKQPPA